MRRAAAAAAACAGACLAGNPLVPDVGMADTNVRFFDDGSGLFLMFATHDFSANNTGFKMLDWVCWSSPDLVHWQVESVVKPSRDVKWSTSPDECWATDGAYRNNKYYFYLSVGGASVAVLSADSPKGPWADVLGEPLLSDHLAKSLNPQTTFRDPCVFQDDDGEFYIIAGVFEYYIAKLAPNMTALAEPPRHVTVVDPYGPCGDNKTDDKPFLHKRNGLYYLSWGCFYGIGKSVYGPFVTQGSVVQLDTITPDFRLNNKESDPWFLTEDYQDRHGSFLEHGGQWYFSSNDRSHSSDKQHRGSYRDTVMCYIHFRANGTMEPCVIDAGGVGSYDAARGAIEAENFFTARGAAKVDLRAAGGGDGFAVGGLRDGSELRYPHVAGVRRGAATMRVRAASGAPGLTVVASAGAGGPELGRCAVPDTGGWAAFRDVPCPLEVPAQGELDLVLRFVGGRAAEHARIDSFTFL